MTSLNLQLKPKALLSRPIYWCWILLLIFSGNAFGQFAPVPVTGFNADIVADGASLATPGASSTAAVDGVNGYVFVSTTFGFGGTPCSNYTAANALPVNKQITSTNTTTNTGITYTLQDYGNGAATNNNALRITTGGTGTLTLVTPINAAKLYLVSLGGGAAVTYNVTINYDDGSSELVTNPSGGTPDWCGGGATYKLTTQQYYRINRTLTACTGDAGLCQYIYEVPVPVGGANYAKNIVSLSFSSVASGILNIMALGMQAPCTPPPAPTGITFGASTTSTVSGSFTASSATGYLVVRYPAGSTPTSPVAGTNYTTGTPLGSGVVVSMGTGTTFSAGALSANTSYDVYVYGYNSGTTCGGPVFSTTALIGTQSTTACGAPTLGTVAGGVRTITVGPTGDAATITAALTDINTNGLNTPTVLELQPTYVSTGETYPITFPVSPCIGSTNTLTLRPAAGANGLVISGSNAGPTIDLNGAAYITIDGRPGGTGTLISATAAGSTNTTNLNIINTNAAGSALKLGNGATFNTIKYCDLQGQNTVSAANSSTIGGVIYMDNTGTLGNDNNTLSYCNIHSTSASAFPAMGIYSLGTNITTGYSLTSNDNNTIDNCNIYDYFNASSGVNAAGIELNYGNNAWIITNNSFFQTASRAIAGTTTFNRAIWLIPYRAAGNVGNGFNVSNNYIGGSAPQCAGAPYTLTGSGLFDGIRIEMADGTTPAASIIQNNTVKNISITSNTGSDLFHGIATAGGTGLVSILDNVIGTPTGTGGATTGGVTLTTSASAVAGHAILLTGTGTYTVQNNKIANFTIPSANSYFTGIFTNGNIGATINNNTIGSLTDPQSIYFSDATSSTSTGRYISGIRLSPSGSLPFTVANNTVAGIWSNNTFTGASGQVVGIYVTTTTANFAGGITGNTVKNLYSAARSTGTTTSSAIIGICASSTSANVFNVSGNVVDSLVSDATSQNVNVIGLYFAGSTSVSNNIYGNFIHTIIAPSTTTATITGILNNAGTSTFANNMVRLGINPDGSDYTTAATISGITSVPTNNNNFYNNSVYIGGTGVGTATSNTFAFRRTGTSGTYNVMNNIFVNNRSNATTGGTHFAVYFTTSNTGATLNSNLYNTTGTGGIFGYSGTANVATYTPGYGATAGWLASDGLSVTGDPQFIAPNGNASSVNLHINPAVASLAESHASVVAAVTDDIDGNSRSGYSGTAAGSAPDIGADEFTGIYINLNCTGAPTAGTATSTASPVCPNISFTLSLTPLSSAQGISYQWQSSPASANTWTNLGTAQNTPFYTQSQTVATDYRCVVTCTASGLSDTSVLVAVGLNSFNNCYCTNTYTNTTSGYITNFTTTGGVTNINNNSTNVPGGYNDFTAMQVSAISNTSFSFSATAFSTNHMGIFVDWNQDGDFTDAGEFVYTQNTSYSSTFSGTIAIPSGALPGPTRMRVRLAWSGNITDPCAVMTYSETEDYTVFVISQTACSGAPAPGNTIASVLSACVTGTTNLSLTNNYVNFSGISYQWQSSINGTDWNDINGATSITTTSPTITQTTSFRCRLICATGPDTAYSNPAQLVIHPLPNVTVTPTQAAFCTSGSATLVAGGASTYVWSPASTLDVSTGNTVVATPTAITSYTVVGTDIYNCSNSATATVGPIDAFTPVGTASGSCAPNLPVTITATPIATAVGSMEYKLTDTLGAVIGDWQAGTTFTVTPTVSGNYKYFLFARNTTCNTNISDTGTVTFYDGFGGTVTAINATCTNGDGSLVVSGVQGPGVGSPTALWYSNDFSSTGINPIYAELHDTATITGGYLQLTPNATSTNGGIIIKNPNAISRFDSVKFDLTIPTSGADGLSWSYGDAAYPATPSSYGLEQGIGDKLIISFDAYGTSGSGIKGIYLTYGQSNVNSSGASTISTTTTSTMLAYSGNASWQGASNTPIRIYLSNDNKLTLKVGTTVIFNGIQLPAAFVNADRSTWKHILAARTGGVAEQHAIDNLAIYANTTSYVYGSSPANSGTVPSTWQSSPIFSGLSGGDSLDIWVANPSTPATCNKFLGTYGVTAPVVTSLLGTTDPSCIGADDGYIILKVNAAGTYNVSYNKNGGNTITQTGLASLNDGTNEYIYFTSIGQGAYTNLKVTRVSTSCVSNTIAGTVTLTAPSATAIPAASSTSGAMNQPGAGTQYYTDASCDLIAGVTSPNNLGTVTANVTVGAPVTAPGGEPFVGRFVDIAPSANANLPATVKLYFTAADFANYNASPSVGTSAYPAILSDNSNLRIRAFHGLPSSGTTGPNGTYDATNSDILQPASVVWNPSGTGFWEVTVYSPNGFSGFFANTTIGTPLNITIGKIAAHNEGSVNIVNWDTKTESANDRFIIERSSDARSFATIGTVEGEGKAPSDYSFTDAKPFNGINYYRLILANADGTRQYSNVVSAEVKGGNKFRLNVFPNPASTEVSVSVSEVIGKGTIELTDITGRVLSSQTITDSATISLSLNGLTDGIYIVKYHDGANVQNVKVNKK